MGKIRKFGKWRDDMRIDGKDYCISCMHTLGQSETCPFCGAVQSEYHSSPRHLMPGTVLSGKYVIGRVLGEGNFGITYIGFDKILQKILAIKEFYPEDLVSRDVIRGSDSSVQVFECDEAEQYKKKIDDFLNEARSLTRFDRLPSIVSVRDFFYENNTAYIVMEYVDGKRVKDYIRKEGPLPAKKVLELMKPLIHSLGLMHGTGMIHRDISPDNILMKEDELVLIDFGAARVRNMELTRSMTVVFKRGYSPEEQYRSKGVQGAWTDIYALCATMYYMLTGMIPEEATQRVLSDEVKPLTDMPEIKLSERQKRAIMKGMAVKTENRFQSMEMLAHELYGEETSFPSQRENKNSRKIALLSLAACLLALFVAGGAWLWARRGVELQPPTATAEVNLRETVAPTNETNATKEPKVTDEPTATPKPTAKATKKPTATPKPTAKPTKKPTATPKPTAKPTKKPTATPKPTAKPTKKPAATKKPKKSSGSSGEDFAGAIS